MALNTKLWRDGGSERLKCGEKVVALNAYREMALKAYENGVSELLKP